MNRFFAILVTSLAVLFGGLTASAQAASGDTYVDTFVVPDPSLDKCSFGNGVAFVGIEGVSWTVNGEPYSFAPAASTLWLPDGFKGTITATSTVPGVELYERSADRRGTSLSWEQVVTPVRGYCSRIDDIASQRSTLSAQLEATTATIAKQASRIERQAETIQRLRAKLRSER